MAADDHRKSYNQQSKTHVKKISKGKIGSDSSIIDVNKEQLDLAIDYKSKSKVPHWRKKNINNCDVIKEATAEQKKFYQYLRRAVLNGQFIDIESNSNYAFILLYDLYDSYKDHKDLKQLERQFKLLEKICPELGKHAFFLLNNQREIVEIGRVKCKSQNVDGTNVSDFYLGSAESKDVNRNKINFSKVPHWSDSYVYSFEEIEHATKAQKEFYEYFKGEVIKGQFVDIEGNTNYAFVLYFDFLNEYQSHSDIDLLESQFKLIGKICPKTRFYSLGSLRREWGKLETRKAKDKLEQYEDPNYLYDNGYSDYNPDMYKLGNVYKKKLGLKPREVKWLNKFNNPSNTFNSIEGCCIAIIESYISVLNRINEKKEIDEVLKSIFDKVISIEKFKFSNYSEEFDRKSAFNQFQESFYLTIFKKIENMVRECYGHKRLLNIPEFHPYSQATIKLIENTLGEQLYLSMQDVTGNIASPNIDTQIELNALNVNRWGAELELAKLTFNIQDLTVFKDKLDYLEMSNLKNSKIEAIFLEAAKFLTKHDHIEALRNYTKYVYYNTISSYKKKDIPNQLKKIISDSDKLIDYESILRELAKSMMLDESLEAVNDLFTPKRKKISLDKSEIDSVRKKHEGTVCLLNKYLETEDESSQELKLIETPDKSNEPESTSNSLFKKEIGLSSIHEGLIKKIVENDFIIRQSEVDVYASQNSLFKNQLIDAINEACEGFLEGEPLIEEEDDSYIIEQSYYEEILE
ncbi:hypothetical protein LVD15_03745 [Fulvivirga maritima]|uniref:tellurite resistance TerB C-terminal domain-containing protein n=1 Tax=Fulvivirga maritima TaxID=2904247 RepID=UPI001F2071D5|nr:tellurite resistance TerB C-terminal domain-containing protein [Fulvivirga maritima]UII27555.1 hypothetical protein LVD15_03745 [Fulvivirga maritima]